MENVILIAVTPDAETVIESCGRICYDSEAGGDKDFVRRLIEERLHLKLSRDKIRIIYLHETGAQLRPRPLRPRPDGISPPSTQPMAEGAPQAQPEKAPHNLELHEKARTGMVATTTNQASLSQHATENVITQGRSPVR